MDAEEILRIVRREMCEYGSGWRADWNDFDGRHLMEQLDDLSAWAAKALRGETVEEYLDGTEFSKCRWG